MHTRGVRTTGVAAVAPAGRRPGPPSSVTTRRHEDGVVVEVRGSLGVVTAPTLHDTVECALVGGARRVVLDLTDVPRGTEAGWWGLHGVVDRARRCGAVAVAAVPDPRLRVRLAGGVAACGLSVVDTVPAMGRRSEPDESARPSPRRATSAAVARDIEDLLHRYGTALVRGDAATASRCHTAPTFVTGARTVLTIPTHDDVESSLAGLAVGYREAGVTSARSSLEAVTVMDGGYCEVTVLWCHPRAGRSSVHARYRYVLRRVSHGLPTGSAAERLCINTVTLLDGPRAVAPVGR